MDGMDDSPDLDALILHEDSACRLISHYLPGACCEILPRHRGHPVLLLRDVCTARNQSCLVTPSTYPAPCRLTFAVSECVRTPIWRRCGGRLPTILREACRSLPKKGS